MQNGVTLITRSTTNKVITIMTIAKDFASKFAVAFVAAAMILSVFAPAVQAAEHDDLQTTINDLLAQVAALQAQLGDDTTTTTTTTTTSCDVPMAPLTIGSQGGGVTGLQNILITGGYSIPAGATGYFGAQTKAALAAWQAASGVAPAVGYYGPISMAALKASCTPDDMDDDDDDSDDSDDDSDGDLSGEGSLDMFEIDDASDDTIEEGQEDAEIAELTLEAQDGDIEISRMDIALDTTGLDDPWEVFDTVSLWVDGEMVAEIDASDEDEYLDEDDYSLRFSGLDIVAMEDEELEIVIGASVQDGVDDVPADWTVEVNEIRYFDADGVATDDDDTEDLGEIGSATTASFSIEMEGDGDELSVRTSSEDPNATTIELEDDEKSEWVTIFAFELDAGDSDGDVDVNGLTVEVDATSDGTIPSNVSEYIGDAMLVIEGEEYDDYDLTGTSTGAFDFDFDDEAVIDADGMVTVEFRVEFESLSDEGATVQANVDGGDVDAESEGGENLLVDGAATGEVHTLRTSGAILEAGDMSEVIKANTDVTTADDEGVFKIEFDVTAFEDDLYIDDTAFRGTGDNNTGVSFQILSGSSVVATGTAVAILDSSADEETALGQSRFLVEEGSTETFTLTVEYDPVATGSFKLQLHSLNFATTNADATTVQRANPMEDFETDSLTI